MTLRHVQGMNKLRRKLRDLPEAMRPEVSKAVQKSGQELAATARALVPVDTGRLKETIDYRVTNGGLGFEVSAGGDEKRTIIQARTVEGGRKPGSLRGYMAAKPFINPARRLMEKRIRGRMSRAISKAAKRVAGTGR